MEKRGLRMEESGDLSSPSSIIRPPSSSSRSLAWLIGIIVIGALAIVLMTLATRWGIGTSKDSVRYIKTARQMLGRETQTWTAESLAESSHFPPLYPALLAAASLPGWDPLVAARWVAVALFAANALLAGVIARRAGCGTLPSLTVALLMTFSPSMMLVHATALSEPLLIALSLAVIGTLSAYLRQGRTRYAAAAGLLAGVS